MEQYEDLFNPSFLAECQGETRPAIPEDATVTMAYVPLQRQIVTYSYDEALNKGTLFPCLNKEFKGRMTAR